MSAILFEVVIILILVLANGVFALSEIAILSARKVRLRQRAEAGDAGAQTALELARDPGRFLATIQVGITLVGVCAGTLGGATLARTLDKWLSAVPAVAAYSQALSVAIVVAVITYLSVVFGELVPKRIALRNAEKQAAIWARPMRLLSTLGRPVVWLLESSSELILRILHLRVSQEPQVTEEEVRTMLEQGAETGIFERAELQMVKGVFRLADRRVGALMTPRRDITWLDLNEPFSRSIDRIRSSPRSRFPVGRGSLNEVVGVVEAKRLVEFSLTGSEVRLEAILQQPIYVPESMLALVLLERFRTASTHTALVVDEYGSVVGIVTPYDIMEAIVGDFPQPEAEQDPMFVQRPDGSWLVDGLMPIDELRDLLGLAALPDEEKGAYSTLAGYLARQFGRLPSAAEVIERDGLRYEVMDMDRHRIDKVLIAKAEHSSGPVNAPPGSS